MGDPIMSTVTNLLFVGDRYCFISDFHSLGRLMVLMKPSSWALPNPSRVGDTVSVYHLIRLSAVE